jgi:hypothetical protein
VDPSATCWALRQTNPNIRLSAAAPSPPTCAPLLLTHPVTPSSLSAPPPLPAGNVFNSLGDMGFKYSGSMRQPFTIYTAALNRANVMADMKNMGTTQFVPTVRTKALAIFISKAKPHTALAVAVGTLEE